MLPSFFNYKTVIAGIAFLLVAAPVSSSTGMVSVEVTTGFGGMVHPGKWTPLSILIENRGRPLRGVLEVLVTSGSEYRKDVFQTAYTRELELPYGSRKRCGFTIPLHSITNDLLIRFRQKGKLIVSTSVSLKDKAVQKEFVLVLDPDIWPGFLASLPGKLYPVRVNARHLPANWYGYDSVRMIILNPSILRRLNQQQFQALEQWIKTGGYLITSAGVNYGAFREARMRRLLPIEINGHQRLSDKAALEAFSGYPWGRADPLMVVNSKVKDAVTLAEAQGIPLVVQKAIARGRIVFLSFDIQSSGFNQWQGKKDFWQKILVLASTQKKPIHELSDQQILRAMLSSIPVQFPSFWPAACFLILYPVGIGVCLTRAAVRKDRGKSTTVCLLLAVSFFSVACSVYYYGKSRMNGLNFNSFAVVSGTGTVLRGQGTFFFGAYPFENTVLRFRFPGSAHPITHLLSDQSDKKIPNPYQVIESPAGQTVKIDSRKWDYDLFRFKLEADLAISANAKRHQKGIALSIDNDSRHIVYNTLAFLEGRYYAVDTIAAGKAVTFTIDTNYSRAEKETGLTAMKPAGHGLALNKAPIFHSTLKNKVMGDLLQKFHSITPWKNDRLLLIGWIHKALFDPRIDGSKVRKEGATLFIWEIPIEEDRDITLSG